MNYKKIVKNQENRFKILNLLKFVPDKTMIILQYKIKLGRIPNIKEPVRFTEKLQWYKLNYKKDLLTICSDKFSVRKYVEGKGLAHTLNKLYYVYDNPEAIRIEDLPEKFVMKTTNGSGTNYICSNKQIFDLDKVKEEISHWINRNIYASGREWAYKNIKPRIIVEELLQDKASQFEGINDYKFLCFNGEPRFVILDVDRHIEHKRNIYDTNWNYIDVKTDKPNIKSNVGKPDGLEEMLNISRILSEDFPFVRVDLYYVNGKTYFGELTFYPWTGYVQFKPDNFDYILGERFDISNIVENEI